MSLCIYFFEILNEIESIAALEYNYREYKLLNVLYIYMYSILYFENFVNFRI